MVRSGNAISNLLIYKVIGVPTKKTSPLTLPIWHATIINRMGRIRVVIERHSGRVEWVTPQWDDQAEEWRCRIRGVDWSIVGYGVSHKKWDVFYIRRAIVTDVQNQSVRKLLNDWYDEIQRISRAHRHDEIIATVDNLLIQQLADPPRYNPFIASALVELRRVVVGTVPLQPNPVIIEAVANYLGPKHHGS